VPVIRQKLHLSSRADFRGRLSGSPPASRVVVIQFESLDKAQAWVNSSAYKAAQAIGEKYATFRAYQAEGISQ
jgi:uncharacterized protein (DUF1330 family)